MIFYSIVVSLVPETVASYMSSSDQPFPTFDPEYDETVGWLRNPAGLRCLAISSFIGQQTLGAL